MPLIDPIRVDDPTQKHDHLPSSRQCWLTEYRHHYSSAKCMCGHPRSLSRAVERCSTQSSGRPWWS